jgi:hypothetical protein
MPGPYTLIFAAKPTSTPTECTTANSGTPNPTANEVIAYATASTAQGTYTYQGIIMCGSTSEWTNQASVIAMNGRWVMVYHDGPPKDSNGNPNRKLHAACLFPRWGQIAGVFRATANSANSFDDCMAGTRMDYRPISMEMPGGNTIRSTLLMSVRTASPNNVEANRYAAGPNERWRWESLGNSRYAIRSLKTGNLLCAPNGLPSDDLVASCTAVNSRSTFVKPCEGCLDFVLWNEAAQGYLRLQSNTRLKANASTISTALRFTEFG